MDPTSDHALMLAVRGGDLDSLGELFERHHRPLFGYLCKLVGDRAAAEDIVQNVFHRILRYRHSYRDDGDFRPWLYQMARHCSADHHRRASSQPLPVDPIELSDRRDESPAGPERESKREERAALHAALGDLDAGDREVLLLSRFQELSFADIARILDCSVGAARVRAHRALRALRERFFELQKESLP